MRRRSFLAGVPAALAVLAAPRIARARVQTDYAYAWAQVWQASVRLVRVDLGCPITDRDEEIGYVMFDYADAGRTHAGSIELVRTTGSDGIERVRAVVQIPSMPSWVERMLLDRLSRKLREDFGEPPRLARPVRSERERPPEDPAEPSDPPGETPSQ
ncbi:hypothetical protein [Sandaracinus amylolyticus]|uniref:Uncharacterized protein n=1 Tax=Sandaracinus amylolyticus TaxID=927083 RepID=A0A0F6W3Z8_9BACT|nr:hypothetical protein [Sandaracinus amylolyticus]AKF06912.1 hypothetical protein DB32_004061 [Sandaracinus amylolyticus]